MIGPQTLQLFIRYFTKYLMKHLSADDADADDDDDMLTHPHNRNQPL